MTALKNPKELAFKKALMGFRKVKNIFKNKDPKKKQLLIIKPDDIGDYILLRNFLPYIKNSKKYSNYEITYLGNKTIKELAEVLDSEHIDKFIWMDRNKIIKKPRLILNECFKICDKFDSIIHPVYSRTHWGEVLIKYSEGKEKIGFLGDNTNMPVEKKNKGNKYYTKLISINKNTLFEFDKNKEFFEKILNEKIKINKPEINKEKLNKIKTTKIPKKFIVIFPGSNVKEKCWDENNFANIIEYIWKKYKIKTIILGNKNERDIAKNIIKQLNKNSTINLVEKTSLVELTTIISKAKLVITNDSCAGHIGPALNIKTIILSRMNHYYRFVPYPKNRNKNSICIVPKTNKNKKELIEEFREHGGLDINLIKKEQVLKEIDKNIN